MNALENRKLPEDLSFVLYQKLARELTHLEEDLTPSLAGRLIREAVDLLPGYLVRVGPSYDRLILRKMEDQAQEMELNIRDAIDSLLIIWNDYHKLLERK